MTKLHQVIAVEKGIKTRVYAFISKAYKALQKPQIFQGQSKKYSKKDEEGEDFPDETVLVQVKAEALLQEVAEALTEYFDIVAAKDNANCEAKADVVVAGATLLAQVPVTHLLFLEKQVTDLSTAIDALPVLDPAQSWTWDGEAGLYKSQARHTNRTRKLTEPLVLYPATDKHPAQTTTLEVDKVVGRWETIYHSGAVPADRKKALQRRVRALLKAVKYAREEANSADVKENQEARKVFDYLLAE